MTDKLQHHKQEVALKYKNFYDKSHIPVEYQVGDNVLIHYPIPETEGLTYQLGYRWRGPFKVMAKLDSVTNRVKNEIGNSIRLFPVHVQRMKKFVVFQQ